jgi:site-specific DNA-methyltransferase (adenine-specific)
MPFGLSTNYRGQAIKDSAHSLALHASDGITYISESEFDKGKEYIGKYKVLISKTSAEHAGEPGKDGMFRIIPSSMKVLGPDELCTHSYFVVGKFDDPAEAENLLSYLNTRFVRFLMLLAISGYGLSKQVMLFVPIQEFSKPWTDEELYTKYELTTDEITLIESMIKTVDKNGGDD